MKIFQIIQKPQARGVELFACDLSEKLKELGHEVILISIFEGDYVLPFSGNQIHLNRSIKRRFYDFSAWRKFAHLVQKEKPDLIQANAADTLKFTIFSKKLFGWNTPIIFRNASQISQYINSALVKGFNKNLYTEVAGILSVSQKSKEDFSSFFNLEIPHQVIPIGIKIPKDKSEKDPEENPILVHIGGFTFEKNHHDLIDIFSRVHKKHPKLKLWLIGDGPLKNDIQVKVQALALQNSVVFKGVIANPFQTLPANSIFVLPSKIEGLPAVILEAFAYKIPVVAYGVGGIPEIVENKKTGWLVEAGNSEAFVNSIVEVLNAPKSEIGRITGNAKALVLNKYSIAQIVKEFERFYLELI